jgi:hypothetical protein
MEFWRLYANQIAEWKSDDLLMAFSYDFGTENVANQPGHPRAFVMGANLVTRWHTAGPWAVGASPRILL